MEKSVQSWRRCFGFLPSLDQPIRPGEQLRGIVRPREPGKSAYSLSVDSVFSNLDNRIVPVSR